MITVENLLKTYGKHQAVKNISFTIDAGEVVGFLGPNGAGKTTTMNMITGYIAATAGKVSINGFDIVDEPEKAKACIGYLPDTPPVYGDMKVDEYLDFVADLKKVKRSDKAKMIKDIKKTVRLEDMGGRMIKNLSKGYKQRVGLAQAMMGSPEVLVLDEPTNGLDPKQIIDMLDVIKKVGEKHTVILSSHILSEVSAVCGRILIMTKGNIVADGTVEELSASMSKSNRFYVRARGSKEEVAKVFDKGSEGFGIDGVKSTRVTRSVEQGASDVEFTLDEGADIREAVYNKSVASGLPILTMKSLDLSLEEIFLRLAYSNGDADDEGGDEE